MSAQILNPYVLGFLSYLGDGKFCTGNPIILAPKTMPEEVFSWIISHLEDFVIEAGLNCVVVDKNKIFSVISQSYSKIDEKSIWQYVAGAYDKHDETIRLDHFNSEALVFRSKNHLLESTIERFCDVNFLSEDLCFKFVASNYIDFVNKFSEVAPPKTRSRLILGDKNVIKFAKCHEKAVIPFKKRPSDSGYDVTVVELKKKLPTGVEYWRTGIRCQMPAGWYMDMVPRSSLSKKGFTITNCVGIIDQSYTGEILVVMHRTGNHTGEIEPGDRVAQLIPRQISHMRVEEVTESDLISTEREEKGFGSSGQK